jgi:hypothetical protein
LGASDSPLGLVVGDVVWGKSAYEDAPRRFVEHEDGSPDRAVGKSDVCGSRSSEPSLFLGEALRIAFEA